MSADICPNLFEVTFRSHQSKREFATSRCDLELVQGRILRSQFCAYHLDPVNIIPARHRWTGPKISDPYRQNLGPPIGQNPGPYLNFSKISVFSPYNRLGPSFLHLAYSERKNRPFLTNFVKICLIFIFFDPLPAKIRTPYRQNLEPPIGFSGEWG